MRAFALILFTAVACGRDGGHSVARVFLITCDTLRADHLGLYGCERELSPALDHFARECIVFDQAYATAPMTQPAISSLLTGRYPEEIGVVPGNLKLLPAAVETLPELLAAHGIPSGAIVSNWILRRRPEAPDLGAQQGFTHYDDAMVQREQNRDVYERDAAATTDAALRWVDSQLAASRDRFFAWFHYQDPHGPYTPPERFVEPEPEPQVKSSAADPPIGTDKLGYRQIPHYQALDGEKRPSFYRVRYDGEIRFFDAELGRLLAGLRERGLLEDALVVFTADHGEALGEHDYWFCHGESVYRDLVRVPLLLRVPGREDARIDSREPERSSALVSHLDILPTVLDAFGLPPRASSGHSLLRGDLPEDRLLAQSLDHAPPRADWRAITDGRHRLIWSESSRAFALYDLQLDPLETTDLSKSEPELFNRLLAEHRAHFAKMLQGLDAGGEIEVDDLDRSALKRLGYLDED